MNLLMCIGHISEVFIDEAELADIAKGIINKKRLVRYGTAVAVASACIAATIWIIRSKRAAA